MAIPVMTLIDGQGGHISLNGIILQPTMYRLQKQLVNANATNTGSGGFRHSGRTEVFCRAGGRRVRIVEALEVWVGSPTPFQGVPKSVGATASHLNAFLTFFALTPRRVL